MKIRKITRGIGEIIFGANVVSAAIMLLTGYSYLINPQDFSLASVMGLSFPFFLLVNLGFLFFWLIFDKQKAALPFIAFLICYFPFRKYFGLNLPGEPDKDCLKVLSYNVKSLSGDEYKLSCDSNEIVYYLVNQNCDIICLQESNRYLGKDMLEMLDNKYPYTMEMSHNGSKIAIYTKYRILSADSIFYPSMGNQSDAFTLDVNGRKVIVINNHLESYSFTPDEKTGFRDMMKGNMDRDSSKIESRSILEKLMNATKNRVPQAEAVNRYIEQHRNIPIILCGDFNDTPISYSHNILEEHLSDAYINSGFGLGWSYCRHAMRIRIDHIMYSRQFTSEKCYVDNKIHGSDHYPIISWLKMDSKIKKN